MKIEVGRYYRNRRGSQVLIESKSNCPNCLTPFNGYELSGINKKDEWSEDGYKWPQQHTDDRDLIAEWTENPKIQTFTFLTKMNEIKTIDIGEDEIINLGGDTNMIESIKKYNIKDYKTSRYILL